MGEISKSIAYENYDIQVIAQKYIDLYHSVLKK